MHQFKIWAPLAKKMAVQVNGSVLPMEGPDEQGFWQLKVDDAAPGADYGFLIDFDSTPYPDPRSEWQPNGVHDLSRVYDQNAFAWSSPSSGAQFQSTPLDSGSVQASKE